jgi:hypothetical protein
MTPRELGGWVPAERHTHYDVDGNETGYTVVERESRIDDADRADLLALALYEAEVCACGYHASIANDASNDFQPGSRVCPVCAGASVWTRIQQEGDEAAQKSMKDAPAASPRPWDGRHSYMRLLTPQQAVAEREKRSVAEGERK